MKASRYVLVDELGGHPVEILHGMAQPEPRSDLYDVKIVGSDEAAFSISKRMVVRINPSEPSVGSVVRVGGEHVFVRRNRSAWVRAGGTATYTWGGVLGFGVGIELLVPDPDDEP